MTTVEPMTEVEEAEAALLTLGAVLFWWPRDAEAMHVWTRTDFGSYTIAHTKLVGNFIFVSYFVPDAPDAGGTSFCPYPHNDMTTAKIACEYHHATGRWKTEHVTALPE